MKTILFSLALFLVSALPLRAASFLTLEEALESARKHHPELVEAKENLRGAESRKDIATAGYYPQVNISADWTRGRSFLTALENIKSVEAASATLNLKQTIYDFGRTAGIVEAARGNILAADQAVEVSRQDLALQVTAAFYLLLAAEKQSVAVNETVRARESVYRQALEFFNQGIKAKVDVARAEANLFAARTALIRAENDRELARVNLANAMGVASLEGRAPVEPPPGAAVLPDLAQSMNNAADMRAELRWTAGLKAAASANLKVAKASYLPVLSGNASLGYADRDFPPAGNVWAAGVNLTVPLFSGFSSRAQVQESNAAINAIEARQENLRLRIRKEVESAWLDAREASARIVSTEKEVSAAEESRALAEGRYREGVGSIIEVTDAQSQALEARTAGIKAMYDYCIALARFDRAVGKI